MRPVADSFGEALGLSAGSLERREVVKQLCRDFADLGDGSLEGVLGA